MYQKPKGTQDVLPQESYKYQELENIFKSLCFMYNYKEMRTPIFERSEVFHRSSGEDSDIVKKETYDFVDRGDRQMTLRPEGTAGIVRAYVENKMHAEAKQVNKIYYVNSPMFRYERPQSGRLRQHTQYGIEAFGDENPYVDAEVISLAYNFVSYVGIKNIIVKLNTLGDSESISNYKSALVEYLKSKEVTLCDDCKRRIDTNPLRTLDCKVCDHSDAPLMSKYRTPEANAYFDELLKALQVLQVPYELDEGLVRGLDYYSNTVFEVQANIEGFGAKTTILGGGRYSNLVELMGGPKTSSIGFGCGIERLLLLAEAEGIEFNKPKLDIFVSHVDMTLEALDLTVYLRDLGFSTEMDYTNRKLKNQLNYANKLEPSVIIVVAEEEYKESKVVLKVNGNQATVPFTELAQFLDIIFSANGCVNVEGGSCGSSGANGGCGCHSHENENNCGCHDNGNECSCNDEHGSCGCNEHGGCGCHSHENVNNCGCHDNGNECNCNDEHGSCGCNEHGGCGCKGE